MGPFMYSEVYCKYTCSKSRSSAGVSLYGLAPPSARAAVAPLKRQAAARPTCAPNARPAAARPQPADCVADPLTPDARGR
eukprot:Skav206926  [mRNA]  locus=scaffold6623:10971:12986:+ [translate_table: standard]